MKCVRARRFLALFAMDADMSGKRHFCANSMHGSCGEYYNLHLNIVDVNASLVYLQF